jgi:hypothetical protein
MQHQAAIRGGFFHGRFYAVRKFRAEIEFAKNLRSACPDGVSESLIAAILLRRRSCWVYQEWMRPSLRSPASSQTAQGLPRLPYSYCKDT